MFERHHEKQAARHYQDALGQWQTERDEQAAALTLAQSYSGEHTSDLMLKPGEAIFATVTGVALVELRRGPGQWQGRSSGFSVPVASIGGRSIRYHIGATKGHYVQGTPHPTPIDTGTLFIT